MKANDTQMYLASEHGSVKVAKSFLQNGADLILKLKVDIKRETF